MRAKVSQTLSHRLRPRHVSASSLPLTICVIIAMTAIPIEGFRSPSLGSLSWAFIPWEVLANVLLFVPFGLASPGFSLPQVAGRAAALSLTVETVQFLLPGRAPQAVDVIANAAGALLGSLFSGWLKLRFGWDLSRFRLGSKVAVAAASALLLLVAGWLVAGSIATGFSTWDPSYKLVVGDEVAGERLWEGQIWEVAIFRGVLEPSLIRSLAAQGPGSLAANRTRLPQEPIFELLHPGELDGFRGRALLEEDETQSFFDQLYRSGKLSILVWCRPAKSEQFGPARILTYSQDISRRNFALGQQGKAVVFRLRTPVTGANGSRPQVVTGPLLAENRDVLLASTYDGRTSSVYVDGHLASQVNIVQRSLLESFVQAEFLPVVPLLFGALFGATLTALVQPRTSPLCWSLSGLGGCLAGLLFVLTGFHEPLPFLGAFVGALGPVGALSLRIRPDSSASPAAVAPG